MTVMRGRPRAADAEERIAAAAVEIYGREGWTGLTFASVAQRANIGKSSLYLRWENKGEMLAAALERHGAHIEDVDTGEMRSDLIALSLNLLHAFDGAAGLANLRIRIDTAIVPELQPVEKKMRETQIAAARKIVRRGVARGEVPSNTPVGLLLNAVCGGVINYAAIESAGDSERDPQSAQLFCERLVDLVLRGLRNENT
jgi:AcrR family transcriptional regulator